MRVSSAGELAGLIHAEGLAVELIGDPSVPVGPQVVIDSRQAGPGTLFVALPGEHVDGADFTLAAAEAGAAAALVNRPTSAPLTHLIVPDAEAGLSLLGRALVRRHRATGLHTVAITGSSGKTSTKDLLAQVLEAAGPTVSPQGSFNNEIGVPLTACQVDDGTRFLISEMGARAIGNIAWLCSIVPPDIAAVLNVGTAHLGEFGSQDAIARAKGEIVEALDPGGWAVLNADDPRVDAMAARTGAHLALWSLHPHRALDAELAVRALDIQADQLQRHRFTLQVARAGHIEQHPVVLQLVGAHQVANATAAATMALALGLDAGLVARRLSQAASRSHWRMELHDLPNGARIINDSYNANPDSMAAAVDTLAAMGAARRVGHPQARTIAILGDMAELGASAPDLHRQLGATLGAEGIDELYAVGGHAADLAEGAHAAGVRTHTVDREQIAALLDLHPGDVVLIKASRVVGLDRLAATLIGTPTSGRDGNA